MTDCDTLDARPGAAPHQLARTLDLGGGRSLHAVQAGSGPDLLLIHGALTTHGDWLGGPFEALCRRHRVTAIDRPGHGLSRRGRFEGGPREQARQIADGLDALGIDRAVVAGHSLGGLVALALAERFPERVAALALIAPLTFPEPRPLEHLLLAPRSLPIAGPMLSAGAEASFDRPLLHLVHKMMFAPQDVPEPWTARYPYDCILDAGAMVKEGEDAAAVLPLSPSGAIAVTRIEAPTIILAGESDRIVNPALHARSLARLMPDARLTTLPGIGHMAHQVATDAVVAGIEQATALGLAHSAAR
jgi:pimeloyl-ACP methyl ester carboxylesterase